SNAVVVRPPRDDGFLDVLSAHFAGKSLFAEPRNFFITSESQRDQLRPIELWDAPTQLVRKQLPQTQTLLQADDAVLNLERVQAKLQYGHNAGDGKHQQPGLSVTEVLNQLPGNDHDIDGRYRHDKKVKRRIEPRVVCKRLWNFLSHFGLLSAEDYPDYSTLAGATQEQALSANGGYMAVRLAVWR